MPTVPTFTAQLLGQTEKAANAILDRLLAKPGLSEPQWVTLSITAMSGGTLPRGQLAERVAGALKISDGEAQQRITELVARRLVNSPDADQGPITLTDHGQRVHGQIRAATTETTQRLWGDLPDEDLATAGRVLDTVLARANWELANVPERSAGETIRDGGDPRDQIGAQVAGVGGRGDADR